MSQRDRNPESTPPPDVTMPSITNLAADESSAEQKELRREQLTEIQASLNAVFFDRARELYEGRPPQSYLSEKIYVDDYSLYNAKPETLELAGVNLKLLQSLNGHRGSRLRRLVRNSQHPAATHLRNLYNWSAKFYGEINHLSTQISGRHYQSTPTERDMDRRDFHDACRLSLTPTTAPEALGAPLPLLLAPVVDDPEAIYERLSFAEKHPDVTAEGYEIKLAQEVAQILGYSKKPLLWKDLVPVVFSDPPQAKLIIDELGFLPAQLSSGKGEKTFNGLEPAAIMAGISQLNVRGDSSVQYERARLTNRFLISGRANGLREKGNAPILVDSNGIMIKLKGFYSHLPFGLISPELVAKMEDPSQAWCQSQAEVLEIKERVADENRDVDNLAVCERQAVENFFVKFKSAFEKDAPSGYPQLAVVKEKQVTKAIADNPEKYATEIVTTNLIIPSDVLRYFDMLYGEADFALARLGEELIRAIVAKKKKINPQEVITEESVVNDPDYYSVTKIAKLLIRKASRLIDSKTKGIYGLDVYRDPLKQARRVGRSEADQLTRLLVFKGGQSASLLINENKHLNERERERLQRLYTVDQKEGRE